MVIGVCSWQLALPECRSLKEKRMVVKSLKERLQSRFRVSVGETRHQDVWTRAELTAGRQADSVLDKMDQFLERDGRALIIGMERSHR
mgnify:CR=1 FL=1